MNTQVALLLFVGLFMGCGSNAPKDSEVPVVITTGDDMGATTTDTGSSPDPGRLPGDETLGLDCSADSGVCDELSCSSELGFREGASPVCTRRCELERELADGVAACPVGFECTTAASGSSPYCMVDRNAAVDVEFIDPSPPADGVSEFEAGELTVAWRITQPPPFSEFVTADSYDIYHGESAEPELVGTSNEKRYTVGNLQDGTQYFWRVIGHFGEQQFESPTWSYTARLEEYEGPCPGRETVRVDGRNVATSVIAGRCWLAENLGFGEPLVNSYALDDGNVQVACPNAECVRGLYTWYEAHNQYPDVANDVADSICPTGFRLPSRAEWGELMMQNINGLRTAYGFNLDGQARATTGDVELCADPNTGITDMKCSRLSSPGSGDGFYWTSEATASEAWRLHIVHEGGGEYTHEFRTARPTFASSVRCIEE